MSKYENMPHSDKDQQISGRVQDIAERMQAVAGKLSQAQKTVIAGQFEREAVLRDLAEQMERLEHNLEQYQQELGAIYGGLEASKEKHRKLAAMMDGYIAGNA